eukprot:4715245-Pyramimonas_sp.AAC.1
MAPRGPKRPPGGPKEDPERPTEAPPRHPGCRKAPQDDPLLAWAPFLDGLVGAFFLNKKTAAGGSASGGRLRAGYGRD